jgi:hypothetical protein
VERVDSKKAVNDMADTNRDNFSPKTKRDLARRAGYVCSQSECSAHTVGPSHEKNDAVSNVGVAAHIAAAAPGPGARRYDATTTEEQRLSIDNGIWLCQTCAKLIDTDEKTYTSDRAGPPPVGESHLRAGGLSLNRGIVPTRKGDMRPRSKTSGGGKAHRFGGDWTTARLDVLAKYLSSYTTALRVEP